MRELKSWELALAGVAHVTGEPRSIKVTLTFVGGPDRLLHKKARLVLTATDAKELATELLAAAKQME